LKGQAEFPASAQGRRSSQKRKKTSKSVLPLSGKGIGFEFCVFAFLRRILYEKRFKLIFEKLHSGCKEPKIERKPLHSVLRHSYIYDTPIYPKNYDFNA
jgi:hypothetical protein